MNKFTPAELKAQQIQDTVAARLPLSVELLAIEAEGIRVLVALRNAWLLRDKSTKPLEAAQA